MEQSRLSIAPCTVKAAKAIVKMWHRHLPELQGGLFAARCLDDTGALLGVAVAGNPSRAWQDSGRIVISRVATEGAENACSCLYGALCRAAKALGYREAWTYTLPDEPGTSLRAAGFMDMGLTAGGEWNRPSRRRAKAVKPDKKRRWLRRLAKECKTLPVQKSGLDRAEHGGCGTDLLQRVAVVPTHTHDFELGSRCTECGARGVRLSTDHIEVANG